MKYFYDIKLTTVNHHLLKNVQVYLGVAQGFARTGEKQFLRLERKGEESKEYFESRNPVALEASVVGVVPPHLHDSDDHAHEIWRHESSDRLVLFMQVYVSFPAPDSQTPGFHCVGRCTSRVYPGRDMKRAVIDGSFCSLACGEVELTFNRAKTEESGGSFLLDGLAKNEQGDEKHERDITYHAIKSALESTPGFDQAMPVSGSSNPGHEALSVYEDHWFYSEAHPEVVAEASLEDDNNQTWSIPAPLLFLARVKTLKGDPRPHSLFFVAAFEFACVIHFVDRRPGVPHFSRDVDFAKDAFMLLPAMFCYYVWSTPYEADVALSCVASDLDVVKSVDEWSMSRDKPFNVSMDDCESRSMCIYKLMTEFMLLSEDDMEKDGLSSDQVTTLLFVQSMLQQLRACFCIAGVCCDGSSTIKRLLTDPVTKANLDKKKRGKIGLSGHVFLRLEFPNMSLSPYKQELAEVRRHLCQMVHIEIGMFRPGEDHELDAIYGAITPSNVCLDIETTQPWIFYALCWRHLKKLYADDLLYYFKEVVATRECEEELKLEVDVTEQEKKQQMAEAKSRVPIDLQVMMMQLLIHQNLETSFVKSVFYPMVTIACRTYHVSSYTYLDHGWDEIDHHSADRLRFFVPVYDRKKGEPTLPCAVTRDHRAEVNVLGPDRDRVEEIKYFIALLPAGAPLQFTEANGQEALAVLQQIGQTTAALVKAQRPDHITAIPYFHLVRSNCLVNRVRGKRGEQKKKTYIPTSSNTDMCLELVEVNEGKSEG